MVFKRMLSAFGAGGPSLVAFLATHRTQPGGTLSGEVRLMSGQFDAEIDQIGLGLLARVGAAQDGEQTGLTEFANAQISGPSVLRQGEERTIEFQVAVPWETPISEIGGRHLAGMMLGVRTEVTVAMAVDKGSPDMIAVTPARSQLRVLQAFAQLGFFFKSASLRAGRLNGVHQDLPFYQGIEFYPPAHLAGAVHEVVLAFVLSSSGLNVVLEAGQHAGRLSSGDAAGCFQMSHDEALHTDWSSEIDRWLAGLAHHARGGKRGHHQS
ncbi:sporulation protein [Nonomuraea sp. NPDC049709]|uniref:sporulation protein n=1 Tax=Nonomuraea sp. NPDC049709 TaxID=3154736 RepID=UPI00343487C7